jgi:hypothetical protein
MHKYTIRVIIKYLKLPQVSDHKRSIIRELYTVLGINYRNGFVVSVDVDVVGVMAAYLPVVRACTAQCREVRVCTAQSREECLSRLCSTQTHHEQMLP